VPTFSKLSEQRLATCDERLQRIFNEVIKEYDCSILCGHRGEDEQNEAFSTGKSTKQWPDSKHNAEPSLAVDAAPYFMGIKIDWNDMTAFGRFAGYVERVAHEQGVRIRWGGDWNSNRRTADETFIDAPHFEIMEG
jgi:peptidoglycan L-alanyl-D-glutamate endopeptidase CwlK